MILKDAIKNIISYKKMNTFITDHNIVKSAKNLDNRRLGKQRVEAIQIANCLLVKESRWKNHPAVKMWKGYEKYLVQTYLFEILWEWSHRGFKNLKCLEHFENLYYNFSKNLVWEKPYWLTNEFIEAHRSNLIKKNSEYYKPLFPNTKEDLGYIWPLGKYKIEW